MKTLFRKDNYFYICLPNGEVLAKIDANKGVGPSLPIYYANFNSPEEQDAFLFGIVQGCIHAETLLKEKADDRKG